MEELNLPHISYDFIDNYPDKETLALKCIEHGRLDVFKLVLGYIEPTITMANVTIFYKQIDFLQHIFDCGLDSQELKNSLLEISLSFKQKEIQRFLLDSGADLYAVEIQIITHSNKPYFSSLGEALKIGLIEEVEFIKKENILLLQSKLNSCMSEKAITKNRKI